MITFVRTTGGSEVSLSSIVEAVPEEATGLMTLFLRDGEIRHATKAMWRCAVQYNSSVVLPAEADTYLLRHAKKGDVQVFKERVLAWLVTGSRNLEPLTLEGPQSGDLVVTVLMPDGTVQSPFGHYESYEVWVQAQHRMYCDPEFTQGTGSERQYFIQGGEIWHRREFNRSI